MKVNNKMIDNIQSTTSYSDDHIPTSKAIIDLIGSDEPVGTIKYIDSDFPGATPISSLYAACDGAVINDADSPIYGKRIRNLNGGNVVLTLTWTADVAGAFATVNTNDVTALNVGDWVTGSGIAADTMIKAIDEDTGIISITDISASGSISTTFNNEGIFIAGGSDTKVSGRDEMQKIIGTGPNYILSRYISGSFNGVFSGGTYQGAAPLDDSSGGANDGMWKFNFNSANSPDARTSSTTAGRTKVHHRRIKAFMKIKIFEEIS